jgi:hypothetical protein
MLPVGVERMVKMKDILKYFSRDQDVLIARSPRA